MNSFVALNVYDNKKSETHLDRLSDNLSASSSVYCGALEKSFNVVGTNKS